MLKKEKIETPLAPGTIANHPYPFSQGWKVGDFVFTGGIAPEDHETGEIVEGAARGIVQGAHEAGGSVYRAVLATLESAAELSPTLDLTEAEVLESVAGSALEAAEDIGPETVDEVRRAIRTAAEDDTQRT